MKLTKPILCLDFDGVIHSYTSGWQGATVIPDPPVDGALDFIADALLHFAVAIYSSRSGQAGGIEAMKAYLVKHYDQQHSHVYGIIYEGDETFTRRSRGEAIVGQIEWPTEKPAAFVGIDDRVLTFTGQWPAIEDLKAFKPWNKKA